MLDIFSSAVVLVPLVSVALAVGLTLWMGPSASWQRVFVVAVVTSCCASALVATSTWLPLHGHPPTGSARRVDWLDHVIPWMVYLLPALAAAMLITHSQRRRGLSPLTAGMIGFGGGVLGAIAALLPASMVWVGVFEDGP